MPWIRLRLPWLMAALAFCGLGVALTAWLPLRADPFRLAERWSSAWWLEPQEQNAFARLSLVDEPLNAVALAADGRTAIAIGHGGTILRSDNAGATWSLAGARKPINLEGIALTADTRTGIAVGEGGTILRSTDGGASWVPVNVSTKDDLRDVSITRDGRTAVAVSGKGTVLHSTDAGATWSSANSGTSASINSVALAADSRVAIAVGSGGTILRSVDSGSTWQLVNAETRAALTRVALARDGRIAIAVGYENTILRSTDAGTSWSAINAGATTAELLGVALAADGRSAIAVGWGGAILRSGDAGVTWSSFSIGADASLYSVALSANGNIAITVGGPGTIVRSADSGNSWSLIAGGSQSVLVGVALSADGGTAIALSQDGTVFRSTDAGITWSTTTAAPRAILTGIALAADGRTAIAAGLNGAVLRSINGGVTWVTVPVGPDHNLRSIALASDGRVVIASGEDDTILRSTDGGQTWSPAGTRAKHPILAIAVAADGRNAIAVGAHGPILHSDDAGATWSPASIDILGQLNGVAVTADGRAGIAVGDDGKMAAASLRTFDAGASWTPVSVAAGHGLLWRVAIAADGRTALAVGAGGNILRSADTGANWSSVRAGNQGHLDAIALAADGRTAIAVGIGNTIVRSTDAGQTWQKVLHRRSLAPITWLLLVVGFVTALPAFQPLPSRKRELYVTSLAGLFTPDRPLDDGDEDVAGAETLATQISRFLRNSQTEPPLTIAVTGPWGTGKSSVLNRLRQDLRRREIRPVWFNAWHHQKEENIFAALLQQVRKQAVPPVFSLAGLRVRTRLFRQRVAEKPLCWAGGLVACSFIVALCLPRSSGEWASIFKYLARINLSTLSDAVARTEVKNLFPAAGVIWALYGAVWGFRDRLKSRGLDPGKLMASTVRATRWTDLGGQLAFRTRFAGALKEVTEALGDRRLTIIIDDLDRCRPDQIAEIMETINFLTNAGHCFVILGIDRKQVLNGIGLAYAAMAKEDAPAETDERKARNRFAENYLRKLIQMEVPVPDFDAGAASRLVAEAGRENLQRAIAVTDRAWRIAAVGGVALTLAISGYFGGDMVYRALHSRPAPHS
jgi:photosystem II stability/assembly factor-like uncharacterized protein/Cdc6-like AAA superfamily ATPase